MSTVGAFVKSKMHNLAVWVQAELGADAKMDYVAAIDARLELELTTFAAMCHSKRDIYDRHLSSPTYIPTLARYSARSRWLTHSVVRAYSPTGVIASRTRTHPRIE